MSLQEIFFKEIDDHIFIDNVIDEARQPFPLAGLSVPFQHLQVTVQSFATSLTVSGPH